MVRGGRPGGFRAARAPQATPPLRPSSRDRGRAAVVGLATRAAAQLRRRPVGDCGARPRPRPSGPTPTRTSRSPTPAGGNNTTSTIDASCSACTAATLTCDTPSSTPATAGSSTGSRGGSCRRERGSPAPRWRRVFGRFAPPAGNVTAAGRASDRAASHALRPRAWASGSSESNSASSSATVSASINARRPRRPDRGSR